MHYALWLMKRQLKAPLDSPLGARNRRKFLGGIARATAGMSLYSLLPRNLLGEAPQKKIASIVTQYRQNSHADVIVTRFLGGYQLGSELLMPKVRIASIHADQFPANDLTRTRAQQA